MLLSSLSSLYLGILTLDIWFTNIFSYSVHCLHFIDTPFFLYRGFFIWPRITILFYFVIFCALASIFKKPLRRLMSWSFIPMFSSWVSHFSGLKLISFIYFKLIFVSGEDMGPVFYSYMWIINYPSTTNRLSLFLWVFLAHLPNISWLCMPGLTSGLSTLSHWSICLLLCQYHTVLMTIALWYSLKSGNVMPLA